MDEYANVEWEWAVAEKKSKGMECPLACIYHQSIWSIYTMVPISFQIKFTQITLRFAGALYVSEIQWVHLRNQNFINSSSILPFKTALTVRQPLKHFFHLRTNELVFRKMINWFIEKLYWKVDKNWYPTYMSKYRALVRVSKKIRKKNVIILSRK